MAIAVDASFPVSASDLTAATTVAVSVTTPAGPRLLVAVVSWLAGTNVGTPTLSGGGLTWTLRRSGAYSNANGQVTQVWTAWATGALSGVTITATRGTGTDQSGKFLAVWSLSGAQETLGAVGGRTGHGYDVSTLADATVVATAAGSWILGGFHHGATDALTARGDTTWDASYVVAGALAFYAGRLTSPTSGAGSVTLGSTTSATNVLTAAVEVLEASGEVALVGTAAGQAAATGTVDAAAVSGSSAGTGAASGALGAAVALGGTSAGHAAAQGSMGAPSIRSGFPVLVSSASLAGGGTITTAAFAANAGDVLVAIASARTVPRLTGSSLVWIPRGLCRCRTADENQTRLFTAVVPAGGVSGETVALTLPTSHDWGGSVPTGAAQVQVFAFDGAAGTGAVAWAGNAEPYTAAHAAQLTVHTHRAGSLVLVGGAVWGSSWAAGSGSTLVGSVTNGMGVVSRLAVADDADLVAGTNASTNTWTLVGIEVLPAGVTPPSKRLIALGDSGSESTESPRPSPVILADSLGPEWELYGAGIWFDTSPRVLARWTSEHYDDLAYAAAWVKSGYNDFSGSGAVDRTSLASIWAAVAASGALVVAHEIIPDAAVGAPPQLDADADWIRANAPGPVPDFGPFLTEDHTTYQAQYIASDGQHYSLLGCQVEAGWVEAIILADELAGASAGAGGASGALGVGVALGGTSAGQAGASAAPRVAAGLSGAAAGQAAAAGAPAGAVPLAGTAAGQAAVQAGAPQVAAAIGGAAAGAGDADASPAVAVPVGGAAAGQGDASGTPVVLGDSDLVGDVAGQGAATGALSVSAPVAGAAPGQAAALGALGVAVPLSGAAAGQAGALGTPTDLGPAGTDVAGTSAGAGGAAGTLSVSVPLAGASAGVGGAAEGSVAAPTNLVTLIARGRRLGPLVSSPRPLTLVARPRRLT